MQMYNRSLESDLFGGKANKALHDKRMKAAARERLKHNSDWKRKHKGKNPQQDEE